MPDILVYALHYEGAINKNSLGAVSEGARLASEIGGECHAIVVGEDVGDELAASLGAYGATKVFRASAPEGLAQPVVDAMAKVIADNGHGYALLGGGLLGFEVGAGLAARLGAGVAMEVTAVQAQEGKLVAERPILGDSAISQINFRSDVGIIIGRLNAFEAKEAGSGTAAVEDVEVELSPHAQQATMVQRGEQRGADVDIEGADVLVAGGRGLGKPEGFELVEELAKAFGGNSAVAATRAVVDAGWYPYAAQIGQTGKTVAPKLYLAAGISGAIQHKVGMQSSENIVAINKDSNAPIFEFSDLAIVGGGQAGLACAIRLLQLLEDDPELTERLGEVPVAVIEKGRVAGAHQLSGGVMNPSAIRTLLPEDDSWPHWGEVKRETVYLTPNKRLA